MDVIIHTITEHLKELPKSFCHFIVGLYRKSLLVFFKNFFNIFFKNSFPKDRYTHAYCRHPNIPRTWTV